MIRITDRYTGEIIYACDCKTYKEAVESAVKKGVSLRYSNLCRLDLSGAEMSGGDFEGALFLETCLEECSFVWARLFEADFTRANLRGLI